MLPAVAQGAIGIERRADDARAAALLEAIHDGPTGQRLAAERAFLAALDGSCETPIAGLAELDGGTLRLRGEILRTDGSEALSRANSAAPVEDGPATGPRAGGGPAWRARARGSSTGPPPECRFAKRSHACTRPMTLEGTHRPATLEEAA